MKPMHSETTRVSRCKCCQSSKSKHNSGKGSKTGNTIGRQSAKKQIRNELKG